MPDLTEAHGAREHGELHTTADVLTLTIGDQTFSGWQRVRVQRGMEALPASFDVQVTEKFPRTPDATIDVQHTVPCTVRIGADLVITGYVDRYEISESASTHTIRVQGRSKSADLVDCGAFTGEPDHPSFQMKGGTALSIAQAVAAPYGVTINSRAGSGAQIPQFNINIGETCWEIIDRITRYSKLALYDLPDGSMLMAQAGSDTMASGFAVGQNIEAADITFAMDQRFSDYEAHMLPVVAYGVGGPLTDPVAGPILHDEGVPRFRKRIIMSEQMSDGVALAQDRALWEMHRRYGRSQQFNLTCDSWRDAAGRLWEPNCLAPISAAALKLADASWLIMSVTYRRDENGQHADLVLMPKEALWPEPVALQPIPPLVQDIGRNNPTKP